MTDGSIYFQHREDKELKSITNKEHHKLKEKNKLTKGMRENTHLGDYSAL